MKAANIGLILWILGNDSDQDSDKEPPPPTKVADKPIPRTGTRAAPGVRQERGGAAGGERGRRAPRGGFAGNEGGTCDSEYMQLHFPTPLGFKDCRHYY